MAHAAFMQRSINTFSLSLILMHLNDKQGLFFLFQHVETLRVEGDTHVRGAPVFCALYKQGGDTRETAWPLF